MALNSLFQKQRAASIVLHQKSGVRRLSDGIDFVGYRFADKPGQPTVKVATGKAAKYLRELAVRISSIKSSQANSITSVDASVRSAARWAVENLSQFNKAPGDFSDLLTIALKAFVPYRHNPQVQVLVRYVERHGPSTKDIADNVLPGQPVVRARTKPVRSNMNHMISIPGSFRPSVVDMTPATAGKASLFARRVVADLKARGRLTKPLKDRWGRVRGDPSFGIRPTSNVPIVTSGAA